MKRCCLPLFLLLLIVAGCTRQSAPELAQPATLVAVFDEFYRAMEEHYVFWDIDSTDWPQMQAYRRDFEPLDIALAADRLRATQLFSAMTTNLIDHHYSITFQGAGVSAVTINPARRRKLDAGLLPRTSNFTEVRGRLQGSFFDVSFAGNTRLLTGMLNAHTVLFKTNQFSFVRQQNEVENVDLRQALDWFFQQAEDPSVRHVVLDLRSCVGGDVVDLNFILGRLVAADLPFGYTKYKQGPAPQQYGPLVPALLRSTRQNTGYVPQIIVLTDAQTASLAETMAYIVQREIGGLVIGETSYGAFSPISDLEIFNAGEITIGDFMTVRTASAQFLDNDRQSLEGKGIVPDRITTDALTAVFDFL